MTPTDAYIHRVLEELPHALPTRSQIAMELRAHIAERLADGRHLDDVLAQLGDPVKLAESYLSAEPLSAATFMDRVAAKVLDILTVVAVIVPGAKLISWSAPARVDFALLWTLAFLNCVFLLCVYTVFAEFGYGQTLGKRALGLRVIRESGRRIGFGQAVVRQLPVALQVIWVDALFALFTERSQRAFELLSKTRVVLASPQEVP